MNGAYGTVGYDYAREKALKNAKILKMMPQGKNGPPPSAPKTIASMFDVDPVHGILYPKNMDPTKKAAIMQMISNSQKLVR